MFRKKAPYVYLAISLLCLITFLIYNQFSHGVTSPFMTWLFGWPLLLGVIPYAILAIIPANLYPERLAFNIYNTGVASLTVSSLLKGIFDIAGNSSIYQKYLMIFGIVVTASGLLVYLIQILMRRTQTPVSSVI